MLCSLHYVRGTHCQDDLSLLTLTLISRPRCVCQVCPCEVTLSPLSTLYSLEGSRCAQPTSEEWELCSPPRGGKATHITWNFPAQEVCLFSSLIFSLISFILWIIIHYYFTFLAPIFPALGSRSSFSWLSEYSHLYGYCLEHFLTFWCYVML